MPQQFKTPKAVRDLISLLEGKTAQKEGWSLNPNKNKFYIGRTPFEMSKQQYAALREMGYNDDGTFIDPKKVYKTPVDQAEAMEQDFNKGLTIDANEKGNGWKKTKMASGTLYEGPNGERELAPQIVYEDGDILPKFQPTKETIWDDPTHPLYSISPSEQDIEFLNSAIKEMSRNLQSADHYKAFGGEGRMSEAQKKLERYIKARDYIKNYRG